MITLRKSGPYCCYNCLAASTCDRSLFGALVRGPHFSTTKFTVLLSRDEDRRGYSAAEVHELALCHARSGKQRTADDRELLRNNQLAYGAQSPKRHSISFSLASLVECSARSALGASEADLKSHCDFSSITGIGCE